jgi:ADP-heptose:LPS heptosyltransferase
LINFDKKNTDTIGIIIAASGYQKRWKIEKYFKIIDFLISKNYKKFLIISGIDQECEENKIKNFFSSRAKIITSSKKKFLK